MSPQRDTEPPASGGVVQVDVLHTSGAPSAGVPSSFQQSPHESHWANTEFTHGSLSGSIPLLTYAPVLGSLPPYDHSPSPW